MSNPSPTELLEPRRMMAVDLGVSFALNAGVNFTTSPTTDTQVTFTVGNGGDTASPTAVGVELFISSDRRFDANDTAIASSTVPAGLAAGARSTRRAALTLPQATPGRFYLIAVLDRAGVNRRVDTNTANNAVVTRKPMLTLVPQFQPTTIDGQTSYILLATEQSDKVGIVFSGDQLVVGLNGALQAVPSAAVTVMGALLLGGNDRLACNTDVTVGIAVFGGAGNDRISGTSTLDVLNGDAGADILFGGGGADQLNGGADNDRLFGGAGADLMSGGDGSDRFFGNLGDGSVDTLNGDAGTDSYDGKDPSDVLSMVETLLA